LIEELPAVGGGAILYAMGAEHQKAPVEAALQATLQAAQYFATNTPVRLGKDGSTRDGKNDSELLALFLPEGYAVGMYQGAQFEALSE
jgi:hypothetical protein